MQAEPAGTAGEVVEEDDDRDAERALVRALAD
jgi:hypothetical protein